MKRKKPTVVEGLRTELKKLDQLLGSPDVREADKWFKAAKDHPRFKVRVARKGIIDESIGEVAANWKDLPSPYGRGRPPGATKPDRDAELVRKIVWQIEGGKSRAEATADMAMKIVEAERAAGVIKDDLDGSRLRSVKSRLCRKVGAALRSTNSEK